MAVFFLNKKPEDLLLLYFSGHGVLDDRGHLYLAVRDTNPELLRATAISADFLAEDMDLCRSKRQILILDCCHSGAFRRGIKGGGKAVTAATFEGNGSGRVVLTASDRREYAMEGNQVLDQAQTSLFTHFLLEGIKSGEADRDGDNFISLDEWYDYAYDKVVSKLPTQTPRRWVYNQEGKLVIARNPKPGKIKPVEILPELRASIEDPRSTIRLRTVSELSELLASTDRRLAVAAREALQQLQNDDEPDVREAASQVLNDHGKSANVRGWLKSLGVTVSLVRWRKWMAGITLAGIIVFAGWALYTVFDRSEIANNEDPVHNEQLEKDALLADLDIGDTNSQTQKTLPPQDNNNDPNNQGNNSITGGDAGTQEPRMSNKKVN